MQKPVVTAFNKANIAAAILDFPEANHNFTKIENQLATGFVTGFTDSIVDWIRNLFDE